MRIVPLAFAVMLMPSIAEAQSLGSHNPVSVPSARSSEWGGDRSTPPRGGFRTEPVGQPLADAGFQREAAKVWRDIRSAQRSGQITRREARAFRRELGSASGFASRSASGGTMSYAASSQSQIRIEGVRSRLVAARTRGLGNTQPR